MTLIVLGRLSLLLSGILLAGAPANADWVEASGDHFVIYGDLREKAATEYAERLERFHAAMAQAYRSQQAKPSPSNRVTVFVVGSREEVREVTALKKYRAVAGVYRARAGGSVAVVPMLKAAASEHELSGETVLYHEYAHHFMRTIMRRAYPRWFDEGFAEFFAGVRFKTNGDVNLGMPPRHRAYELADARSVPIRSLLDFDGGAGSKSGYDSFYGQSWLLFHYLQMEPERTDQLTKYVQLLAAGGAALEAAEGAFGDLQELDRDMKSYIKRKRMSILRIPQEALSTGPVTVRKLRPGEAAMMPVMMESKVGVGDEEAKSLVPEARKVAAQHPDDPAVLAALAEAEFDAGNDDEAIAAADRALAIDAKQVNAHIQKGYALTRKVKSGALPSTAWKDVRNQFVKANQVENAHPVPLVQFYLSYVAQGLRPTKNAIDGLVWAMELAPFDGSLRWMVAQQMISDERVEDAANALAPLAYSPHPGEHTDKARELLKDVESRLRAASDAASAASKPSTENGSEPATGQR